MGYDLSKEQQRLNDIKLLLKDLLKVVKVVAMYPEGNPLPESLKRSFAERLTALVEIYSDIKLSVGRDTISLGDETVYSDTSKEDSLAGLFFDPGITSITFKKGLEIEEVYRLLEVLKNYSNTNRRSDLVAQIWEANISGIVLTTVEDIALAGYEGDFRIAEMFDKSNRGNSQDVQLDSDQYEKYNSIFFALDKTGTVNPNDSGSLKLQDSQPLQRPDAIFYATTPGQAGEVVLDENANDEIAQHAAEAAEAMGFGDLGSSRSAAGRPSTPNTALILNDEFKLSEEEEQDIGKLLVRDAQFDPHESIIELLKEMLLQETELRDFIETVQTCEKVMSEFVRSGRLAEAGQILSHFKLLQDKLKPEKPKWSERLKDASTTAGSRNRLKILHEALSLNDSISSVELRRYLELLGWEAMEGLVDLLGELQHEPHRRALCDHFVAHGKDHLPIIGKGVFDKRWYVVRNAVMILAQIDDDRAVTYLERAAGHAERRVRLEVMQALKSAANPKAVKILQRAALDTDSDIRALAHDSLIALPREIGYEAISSLVTDDRFSSLDMDDQQRILNSYSIVGGEDAVAFLQSLIQRRNLWRDSTLAFLREAAFEALSHNRSEKAEQLLVSLGNSVMPGMKRMAQAALRRRREHIYGEHHERIQ